jgi:hypothetical protein
MSDHVIDLQEYLKGRKEERRGAFSIWGGDGERSRFALPMWRAIYLVRGHWGALLWGRDDHVPRTLQPYFVLDLESEPARTTTDADMVAGLWSGDGPQVRDAPPGSVSILLGSRDGRRWFLVLLGDPREDRLEPRVRDDLLFLAGECAGLLFHQDLAGEADPAD